MSTGRAHATAIVGVLAIVIVGQFCPTKQASEPKQGKAFIDETKECLGNHHDQASLNTIKPQVFYYEVGGNLARNGLRNTYKKVFNLNYRNSEFEEADIDPRFPTKVITHGFKASFNGTSKGWIQDMIDTLAQSPRTTYNVFVLNWPNKYVPEDKGTLAGYGTVAGTTRTMGSYLGSFLLRLGQTVGVNFNQTHLIGHSLGAQLMGFAGKYLKEHQVTSLSRITGLDPAGPCFNLAEAEDRLDHSDARYVDAIHTNLGQLGTFRTVAHRDVIISNGAVQTGCEVTNVTCSHQRAHNIFTYFITRDCQMVAYQCKDHHQFEHGDCKTCQEEESRCTLVNFPINFGYDEFDQRIQRKVAFQPNASELELVNSGAEKHKKSYFVGTGDDEDTPLCQQHYQVRLITNVEGVLDDAELTLIGDDVTATEYKVTMKEQNKNLYTGLLAYAGRQIHFSRAVIKVVASRSQDIKLAMSVAFMSHISPTKRQSYSSILCMVPLDTTSPAAVRESKRLKYNGGLLTLVECASLTSDQFELRLEQVKEKASNGTGLFSWIG